MPGPRRQLPGLALTADEMLDRRRDEDDLRHLVAGERDELAALELAVEPVNVEACGAEVGVGEKRLKERHVRPDADDAELVDRPERAGAALRRDRGPRR